MFFYTILNDIARGRYTIALWPILLANGSMVNGLRIYKIVRNILFQDVILKILIVI